MKPSEITELAECAYSAWIAKARPYLPAAIPLWDDLPAQLQLAWEESTARVLARASEISIDRYRNRT